jgi:hypothetical protein
VANVAGERHHEHSQHRKQGFLAVILPFDGYARPILFSDGALIIDISIPANAVADCESSGLVTGHFHH